MIKLLILQVFWSASLNARRDNIGLDCFAQRSQRRKGRTIGEANRPSSLKIKNLDLFKN